jgi:hypothetical protein
LQWRRITHAGGSHTHSGCAEEITCRIGVAACDFVTLAFSPREKVLDVGGGYEDDELGVRLAASV